MLALESPGAILSKCYLRCLKTLPRKGKQVHTHTHTVWLPLPLMPHWLPCCVFLSLIPHGTLFPPSSLNSVPSSTCSASLPPDCLYLSLASPNSLQAYTHSQLFLLLSQSDLTGEHSCPATIPPHGLFCFRPFPLTSSATSSLPSASFHSFFHPSVRTCCIACFSQVSSVSNMFLLRFFHLCELPPYWSWKVWVPWNLCCLEL